MTCPDCGRAHPCPCDERLRARSVVLFVALVLLLAAALISAGPPLLPPSG